MCFFVKDKNSETFIPLGEFSYNSIYFRLFEGHAPQETIAKVNYETLQSIITTCREKIKELKDKKKEFLKRKTFLFKLQAPVARVMEEYDKMWGDASRTKRGNTRIYCGSS